MRLKDIVRITVLACTSLGLYYGGSELQLSYAEEPPYMYFWVGVILEFVSRVCAALLVLYIILRLGLAYSRHELHWPNLR